jgi:hypothetical protein
VGEEVVQTDLQPLGAGGRPERAAIGAFEDFRLLERGPQPGWGIAVGANGVVFDVVSGPATWGGSSASRPAKTRFIPIRWSTS